MECIALIIVAVIIFLDLLHERECKKIYKENRCMEQELRDENKKIYEDYRRREEEKRRKREKLRVRNKKSSNKFNK